MKSIHLYYGVNIGKWEAYGQFYVPSFPANTQLKPLKQKGSDKHFKNRQTPYFKLLILL